MNVDDFDFEGSGNGNNNNKPDDNGSSNQQQQQDVTHLDGGDRDDPSNLDDPKDDPKDKPDNTQQKDNPDIPSTGELHEGDSIEFDGATYTVDANGNLVDDKGAIFKEAKDVADWLKSVDVDDSSDEDFSISQLQEKIGITVTDEDGKNIEFTDDADGVKAYVDAVLDLKSRELQEAAVNKLYADNPLLKQFVDYVSLNGTAKGFGDIPDRSNIQLDKDNEEQLKAVIRMAAKEFGNKSLNENYLKYLKDSGSLYDEAKAQLQALVEKDEQFRQDIAARAEAQRVQEEKDNIEYWNRVNNVINSRIIAGYKLPESFTKEVNGQKVIITPDDFYKYLSKATETDAKGNKVTGYQRDLSKLSDEQYLNRELLDAWLMFTGGSYKDLIGMAVNENNVRQLKLKSKEQHTTKTVKVVKKQTGKVDINDIVL